MDIKQLHTIFRNHTHTGDYPDAKKLPDFVIPGGKFSPAIVLRSSGGNRFILSVSDDGAFTVEPITFSHILVSPSGYHFVMGVDSDGAPTLAESRTRYAGVIEYTDLPLRDSVGTLFYLYVDDNGVIMTRLA